MRRIGVPVRNMDRTQKNITVCESYMEVKHGVLWVVQNYIVDMPDEDDDDAAVVIIRPRWYETVKIFDLAHMTSCRFDLVSEDGKADYYSLELFFSCEVSGGFVGFHYTDRHEGFAAFRWVWRYAFRYRWWKEFVDRAMKYAGFLKLNGLSQKKK